jgi:hypothetical protein
LGIPYVADGLLHHIRRPATRRDRLPAATDRATAASATPAPGVASSPLVHHLHFRAPLLSPAALMPSSQLTHLAQIREIGRRRAQVSSEHTRLHLVLLHN